jgi:hypothetical protein
MGKKDMEMRRSDRENQSQSTRAVKSKGKERKKAESLEREQEGGLMMRLS